MVAGPCDLPERWKFPVAEGVTCDEENGCWTDADFFDDMSEEELAARVWRPAEPTDPAADAAGYERWREFVATAEGKRLDKMVTQSRERAARRGR